jgi:hypothetical protein
MKKPHLILAAFALIGTLSACGAKSITQAQAVEAAKKIQAKHSETSFAYPQDKLTMTESSTLNGLGLSNEYRIIKGQYFYVTSTLETPATSAASASKATIAAYLYSKDSKYYQASDNAGSKTYSELTQADFTSALSLALNGDGTSSNPGAYKTIDGEAENAYSTLSDFIKQYGSSSASSSVSSSSASAENITMSFASTGDGNLTLSATTKADSDGTKEDGQETIVFNNYYPESMSAYAKGTTVSSSSSKEISLTADIRFHWDSCDPIYPDLSQYTNSSAS